MYFFSISFIFSRNKRAFDYFSEKVDKVYHCDTEGCGKTFASLSYLRDHHMIQHEGQKSLKCGYVGCERMFSWPAHLRYHERTHT